MLKRLLPFLPIFFLIGCFPPTASAIGPEGLAAAIQTLTATVWTPAPISPTVTPIPITGKIVDILNDGIVRSDPLAESIEAKFNVIDVQIIYDPPLNIAGTLSIHIECEWIYSNSCTLERAFIVLMHAFTVNDKTFGKITEQVPTTVHTLQVVNYNHMTKTGMIIVPWTDIVQYTSGNISGSQLGLRITRLAP